MAWDDIIFDVKRAHKSMKTLLTIIFSICLLSGGATADDVPVKVKEQKPLDNRGLHQLCKKLGGTSEVPFSIKGTEVRVKVKVHIRQDKTVWSEILIPEGVEKCCSGAHLVGFEPHFSSGLKDGEEYLLEGMIVEDRNDFGAFWVYASRLTRAEKAATGQPATRSESKSEGSDKPQPESEGRSR